MILHFELNYMIYLQKIGLLWGLGYYKNKTKCALESKEKWSLRPLGRACSMIHDTKREKGWEKECALCAAMLLSQNYVECVLWLPVTETYTRSTTAVHSQWSCTVTPNQNQAQTITQVQAEEDKRRREQETRAAFPSDGWETAKIDPHSPTFNQMHMYTVYILVL